MPGQGFREWVERGFQYYEKNPWVFFRELAQNSRDAGATGIDIHTECVNREEKISFADNGAGMGFGHAQNYLFRLYASSKIGEKNSAGFYGIGFWTVLRFKPKKIIIESHHGGENWALELDAQFNSRRVPSGLTSRGTRITLIRTAEFGSPAEFQAAVSREVSYYSAYLRRNDKKGSPLPVRLGGKSMSRKMELPGPLSVSFRNRWCEGVVGLASQPAFTLYARGLPVLRGTSLDELSQSFVSSVQSREIGQGLSPVFLINGRRLFANINRREVMDDRVLKKVRRTAEKALDKLVESYVERAFPGKPGQSWRRKFGKITSFVSRSPLRLFIILLILLAPLEFLLLQKFYSPGQQRVQERSLLDASRNFYPGPSVNKMGRSPSREITYQPPRSLYLKIFCADTYDRQNGFGQNPHKIVRLPDLKRLYQQPFIFMDIKNCDPGVIFLPVPAGYDVDPASIRANDQVVSAIRYSWNGEVIVTLTGEMNRIRYRCGEIRSEAPLSEAEIARLTSLPGDLAIPAALDRRLRESSGKDSGEKIRQAGNITQSLLEYDQSTETIARYAGRESSADWLARVCRVGKGDCDVLNGLTVLILRYWRIPARLVIGLVGEAGIALPQPHAWVEYFHAGWKIMDSAVVNRAPGEKIPSSTSPRLPAASPGMSHPDQPVLNNKTGPDNEFWENEYVYYPLGMLLGGWVIFLLWRLNGRFQEILAPNNREEIRKNLGQILLRTVLYPGAGFSRDYLWNQPIIPTLGGENVSLEKVFQSARRGKLFSGRRSDQLARKVSAVGLMVLDSLDPAFHPLVRVIPRVINLDGITSLRLQFVEEQSRQSLSGLILAVNRIAGKLRGLAFICHCAPGLSEQDVLYQFISPDPRLKKLKFSSFIAVNPESQKIKEFAGLQLTNPQLAVFRFFNDILPQLRLSPAWEKRMLHKISRLVMAEIHG